MFRQHIGALPNCFSRFYQFLSEDYFGYFSWTPNQGLQLNYELT